MAQHGSEWSLGLLAWPLCSHPESSLCSRTGLVIPRGVWLVVPASVTFPQKARRVSFHLLHQDSSGTPRMTLFIPLSPPSRPDTPVSISGQVSVAVFLLSTPHEVKRLPQLPLTDLSKPR